MDTDCNPQHTEGFRKRWFTMDDRRLMYFKDPLVRKGHGPGQLGPLQAEVSPGAAVMEGGAGSLGLRASHSSGQSWAWTASGPESKQQPLPPHLACVAWPQGAGDLAWLSPAPALRTPSPVGKSSSAAGSAATLCWTGSRHPRRATTGRMASRSSRQSAGSCWHVRLSQSGGRGQQLFGRLWTGPCCPRNMQVRAWWGARGCAHLPHVVVTSGHLLPFQWKPTSSINRSRAGPGGPRNPDSCDLASEDTAARLWRPTARGGWPPGPCPEGQPQSGAAGT